MSPSKDSFRVINRQDDDYEVARVGRVFNGRRPERYPRAVIEATCESDIVDAVRLAIKEKCRVSIRSGGHSWAAWSVRDDTILVDLGNYKYMELDEENMTIVVSPSTTGRILNTHLSSKGLMFGGGHCPDVGLGGFLLQGGMGWNCRNWGWACEQVLAIDVVDAKGELIHCDAEQNSKMYWAARGCGPGLPGFVTKFYLRVRRSYTKMLSSAFFYPLSEYKPVMDWITRISPDFDNDTEIVAVSAAAPPESGIDGHCMTVVLVVFKNDEEESRAALKPAHDSKPPGSVFEIAYSPTSLANEYKKQAAANPQNHRYCCDNAYVKNDADVTAVLEEAFTTLPHIKAFALWFSMNPCSRRELPDMALSMHSDHYFALYTIWEDATDDDRCRKWVKDVMTKVEQQSEGAYLGDSDFQIRRTKFWSDANAAKLMQIRRELDPEGVFCGYLDESDRSGVIGLKNEHEWINSM